MNRSYTGKICTQEDDKGKVCCEIAKLIHDRVGDFSNMDSIHIHRDYDHEENPDRNFLFITINTTEEQ